jgi:hypothetical protein
MRLRQSRDLEPDRADAWLAVSPGAYYRTLRNGHLRAVFREPLRLRDKLLALSATTIRFAERFGVSSAPLRLALRGPPDPAHLDPNRIGRIPTAGGLTGPGTTVA